MNQNQIIEKLIRDIQLRGFSKDTEKDYSAIIRRFQEYFQKPANELGEPEIRKYLLYLAVDKKLSPSTVNSCNSALRFLYEVTLEKNLNYRRIPRMKDPIILPNVLNKDEVQAIFDVTDNLKHKCILTTIYGSGLRLSEATTLKVSDIDSKNMRIFIEQAKGKKDRYVLLSQTNLDLLREYWKQFKPRHWLFEGMEKGSHITKRGVQDIFKKYLQKSHITKKATVHTLRQTAATLMYKYGKVDIRSLQEILGHESVATIEDFDDALNSEIPYP